MYVRKAAPSPSRRHKTTTPRRAGAVGVLEAGEGYSLISLGLGKLSPSAMLTRTVLFFVIVARIGGR